MGNKTNGKSKNGKMTLEKLARMMADGFGEVNGNMNTRFSAVDKRLGKIEYQVDEAHDILKRFEENDILNLQKRVQILEKAVRALASNQPSK